MNFLERFFKLRDNGTTIRREIYTGTVTFLAVSYILAVNPEILSSTGMNRGGLFYVTAISAFFGTLSRCGGISETPACFICSPHSCQLFSPWEVELTRQSENQVISTVIQSFQGPWCCKWKCQHGAITLPHALFYDYRLSSIYS